MQSETLPRGWSRVRLGEILEQVQRIENLEPDREYRLLGVKWYGQGVFERERRLGKAIAAKRLNRIEEGDFVYNRLFAWKGSFAIVEDGCAGGYVSGEFPVFRPKQDAILPRFLFRYFSRPHIWQQIEHQSTGTTNVSRNRWREDQFLSLCIALPPLEEQERITGILSCLDKAIRTNEDVLEHTVALKKTLARELFSRGLPGRHVLFKGSSLGRIPAEWSVATVGEVGRVQLGRQRAPAYQTGRFPRPYLRVANVFDGFINYTNVHEMDFDDRDFESYRLAPDDILLNEGQSRELVGRSAIYKGPPHTYCFQNTLIRFQPSELVLTEFAQSYFQYCLYTGIFARAARQTTSIAHLGADNSRMPLPVPHLEEQRSIGNILVSFNGQLQAGRETVRSLERVREMLSAVLFSGS